MQKLIQKRLTGDYLYHHINYLMKNYINPISDVLEKSGMNWNEVEHKIEAGDEQWDEWQAVSYIGSYACYRFNDWFLERHFCR